MTRRVVTVGPSTPLDLARLHLTANRFTALPVVDDRHRLVGIVTAGDLLAADTAPEGTGPRTVGAVMTPDPLRMAPDADVAVLDHRLRHYGDLRAMPIVETGVLVGVVAPGDLLRLPPGAAGSAGSCTGRTERARHPRHRRDRDVRTGPAGPRRWRT